MNFLPQEIIRRKRDGSILTSEEISAFVEGISNGNLSEGQIAAFAMAVFLRGMNMEERVQLTRAMARSGTLLEWESLHLPGPVLDKHSTGGVGDKVSLMLAPMIAACGGFVPMISGRGLGHTGGTLDKLDGIPGYQTQPDLATFQRTVQKVGCAIVGQTSDLAPADRRLYAIRDVTATVESIPLITASILSKKLAAGLSGLVMDVKFGSGAFAQDPRMARELAESIAKVATQAGLPTIALLTDMNQVLGRNAGNHLELLETIQYLTGEPAQRDSRLHHIVLALGAEMLVLGKLAKDQAEAEAALLEVLTSGQAATKFQTMVSALGGPADLIVTPERYLPEAPICHPVESRSGGFVTGMDVRQIGLLIVELGGGRRRASDPIDHRVGFSGVVPIGSKIDRGEPLAFIHAANEDDARRQGAKLQEQIWIGDSPPGPAPLILEKVAGKSGG